MCSLKTWVISLILCFYFSHSVCMKLWLKWRSEHILNIYCIFSCSCIYAFICVCVCVFWGGDNGNWFSFLTVTLCFAEAVQGIWLCTPLSCLKRKEKNHPTENNSCWKVTEKDTKKGREAVEMAAPEMDDEKFHLTACFSFFLFSSPPLPLLENMTQLKACTYATLLSFLFV